MFEISDRFSFDEYIGLAPEFLSPRQKDTYACATMILRDYQSVMVCDGTGTGKTYIALAIARYAIRNGISPVLVAPAHLLKQWNDISRKLDINILDMYSYQKASLGKIARRGTSSLWIIDEAHMLKNPDTMRYRNLYSLTRGHRVCLLTATPVSMGMGDLYSLGKLCGYMGTKNPDHVRLYCMAISPMSYCGPMAITADIHVSRGRIYYGDQSDARQIAGIIDKIRAMDWPTPTESGKCTDTDILSHILISRLLSHPKSCIKTIGRMISYYKSCRLNGKFEVLTHEAFNRMAGREGSQKLIPFDEYLYGGILDEGDKIRLDKCLDGLIQIQSDIKTLCGSNDKIIALGDFINKTAKEDMIVVFSQYTDSLGHIAKLLNADRPVALWTSKHAVYRGYDIDPEILRAMFDPNIGIPIWWDRDAWPTPKVLLCSDGISCGHNLHAANILVHFDLPWNPTTIVQREGRIIRNGTKHAEMTIAEMTPTQGILRSHYDKIKRRLNDRAALAGTWAIPDDLPVPDELILIPQKGIPGLWAKFGTHYIPVPPSMMRTDVQYQTHKSTTARAFEPAIAEYRKELSPQWNDMCSSSLNARERFEKFLRRAISMALWQTDTSKISPHDTCHIMRRIENAPPPNRQIAKNNA